jgi:hypothetical protein
MQRYASVLSIIALMVGGFVASSCGADSLVGVWQAETGQWGPNATDTNSVVQTIEFGKDYSFKLLTYLPVPGGGSHTNLLYTGTYALVGTNQVRLTFKQSELGLPPDQGRVTALCSIVGEELVAVIPDSTSEFRRYRRAR